MCFGCIRLDQVNRTQIIAEKSEQGCLFAYTDREKDPDINRASAKPLWIPILGLRDSSWHKELLPERVAGSFSARHAALPRMHYEQDSRVSRITGIMVSVVQRAREVLASVGEDHLPVRGGWSFFGPLQTSTETDPVGLEPAEDIVSEEESS